MYLFNNNRQWTEDAKGEFNVPTQNSTLSLISKIKHCTIQDYYLIKPGIDFSYRLCMLHNQHNYNHDMLLTKTYSKNTPLFAVI